MYTEYLISGLLSYLIGAVPVGLFIGKMYGIDIREYGSKNIGATNIFRTIGIFPAFLVFLGDSLKGICGVVIAQFFLEPSQLNLFFSGLMAIIGHSWPIYLKFKGGRSVATSLGVLAITSPIVTVIVFTIWLIIVLTTKYVSLASIVAAIFVPVLMFFLNESLEFTLFWLLAAIFVIYRHKVNIKRLLKGEELKIKKGSLDKTQN